MLRLAIVSVLLLGCQRQEQPAESAPSSRVTTAPRVQAPKPGEPIDVHGIVVTFRQDGMIEIRGRDTWGNAIDAVYENIEFFRKALPVIDKGLTADQAMGLQGLLPPT
jgi:hypothetical protein